MWDTGLSKNKAELSLVVTCVKQTLISLHGWFIQRSLTDGTCSQSACSLTTIMLYRVKFRLINDKLNPNNLAVNVSVCECSSRQTICNQFGLCIVTAASSKILHPHNNLSVNSDNRLHCNISSISAVGRQLFPLDLKYVVSLFPVTVTRPKTQNHPQTGRIRPAINGRHTQKYLKVYGYNSVLRGSILYTTGYVRYVDNV